MANRRDIELLISAKETTGRSFKQVTDNIASLNSVIAEQIEKAERGEISLQDLRKTQEALSQAGRDLAAIQGQIDGYTKLAASTDKAAAANDAARAKLEAFRAELAKAEKVTATQEAKLQRLETAFAKTSAAIQKNETDLANQTAVLNRAGVAVDQLDAAQAGIVNTARQIGGGLSQVNAAMEDYTVNVQRAKDREIAARKEATAAQQREAAEARLIAAEQKVALAQETAAQQEAARERQAALVALREAEQRFAQQDAFDKKISEAQRLGDASRFIQLFGNAIDTVAAKENQLSALTGFRAVGAMAAEASRDMSRFVQTGQAFSVTSSQVAAGLRNIVNPGAAALSTLDGIEQAIRDADAASAEGVKNVTILNNAYNNLAESSAALLRQGALVDTFRQQEAAVAQARAQFEQAQADVQRFGNAMAQADVPTEALVADLRQAEAVLEATGRALSQEENRLGELVRTLQQAAINTADLAAEQRRLEAAATTAGGAMRRIEAVTGRGGAPTTGFLGLKPQDLVNVGYQVNDIVVSLMSGQKPLTVFVQQGAQLAQIPGFLSAIAGYATRFLPLLAVIVAIGAAINEVYTDSKRLEQAQKDLATIPTGEGLDPAKFAAAGEALENMGAKAEDARAALLLLAEEGFNDAQIATYSEAAQRLAERLGVDLAQATQMLVDIQKGGIETVYELAEKTNDLTTADLNHAEALFEAGRAAEARQFILDRVAERNEQIARATESVWTPAVKNLQAAWTNFTNWLSSTFAPVISGINKYIDDAIIGFTYLTALLAGKGLAGAEADARRVFDRQRGQAPKPERGESDQQLRDRQFKADLEDRYVVEKNLTREQRLQRAEAEARADAQAAGVSKAVEDLAVAKARTAEEYKLNQEAAKAAKKSQAARDKAARAAKAEENRRQAAQKQLTNQLRQLDRAGNTGAAASLEQRLEAIDDKYASIYDSIKKVRALGLGSTSDGRSLAAVEAEVEATKDRLKAEETIKFYQDQAARLQKQRDAEIKNITDAQARGALSARDAVADANRINKELSPQIVAAARSALEVASQLAKTNPSPEMISWIASLENLIDNEPTNGIVAEIARTGLDQAESELNTLLQQRDGLVDAYNSLGQAGLRTSGEVRAAMQQAFTQSALDAEPMLVKLREAVEVMRATKNELTGLPLLTDTAYNAWLLKIEQVKAGLQQTNTYLSPLENDVFQGLANAGAQAFSTLASSMGEFLRGTKSLGDVFEDVGRTVLGALAGIMDMIAQVIIKFLILTAMETAMGLPPGTLVRLAGSGGGSGGRPGGGLFGIFHSGGKIGSKGGRVRRDNPANWIGAPKFHTGGGLGLRKDEYRAILQRGEEVLAADNPRHIDNYQPGGSAPAAAPPLKQVLLLDPNAVPDAMKTRAGQKSVLTVIRQNKETIKQVLA